MFELESGYRPNQNERLVLEMVKESPGLLESTLRSKIHHQAYRIAIQSLMSRGARRGVALLRFDSGRVYPGVDYSISYDGFRWVIEW